MSQPSHDPSRASESQSHHAANQAKCHSIYWNLLELIEERPDNNFAAVYIRELQETARCDQFVDFKYVRNDLVTKMESFAGPGAFTRILNLEEADRDKAAATQAVVHYWYWHREQLRSAISWPAAVYYWTWFKAERMFAFIGLAGSAYQVSRWLGPIAKAAKNHKIFKNPGGDSASTPSSPQ